MMDGTTFRQMTDDPAVFRRELKIIVNRAVVPFRPDPWQEADFRAMDDAWRYIAGRWQGDPPAVLRLWSERPRGHSKTSDLAVSAVWALLFARRPLTGLAIAADQDQAAILLERIGDLLKANPFVAEFLTIQKSCVVNTAMSNDSFRQSKLKVESSDVASSYGALPDFLIADELSHWQREGLWTSLFSSVGKQDCVLTGICNADVSS